MKLRSPPTNIKSSAFLLLVALTAVICASCTAASSSSNNDIHRAASIALPEARVADFVYQGQTKKTLQHFPTASTEIRGGANTPIVASRRLPAMDAISGIVVMALIESGLKKFFRVAKINFPSQLGGCIALFFVAVLAERIHPGWGDGIQDFLVPGSALLSKWLPAFFVPGLAMLPLAPSMGSGLDIAKAFAVVVLGLVYSMSTISFSVLALRKAQGATNAAPVVKVLKPKKKSTRNAAKAVVAAPQPFPKSTLNFLAIGCAVSFLACVAAFKIDVIALATPLQTATLIFATLVGYVGAVRMPASITKVVHPLIISSAVTVAMVQLIAYGIGSDLTSGLKSYKAGTLNPLKMGAGDVLLWLLGPSVVSFAVSMYSRKALIYENLLVIMTAVGVASAGGLFFTAAFVRAISVGGTNGSMVRLSLLPRNITTALAMVIANIIGGDISIAAVAVVFTGVIGATYGKVLLKALGIHDPVTRGLAMGGAAQGLGVSAMSNEPDAFPFAAIAMVLSAAASTIIVSIPALRDTLIKLATGDIVAAAITP